MTHPCADWEEIDGFTSPSEYERFVNWMGDRAAEGAAERVPVEHPYAGGDFGEQWFRCPGCGTTWRLVEPDPPFYGVFAKVDPKAPDR